MRLQEAVNRRVAIVVKPAVDESLLGYLTRVAETNVLERPTDILHEICAWPPGYLGEAKQASIARVVGIQPRELRKVYWRSWLHSLPRSALDYERRRVAPAALRASPHHRFTWLLKRVDFCPESWRLLIDACPSCGASLSWGQPSLLKCGKCSFDLSLADSEAVPHKLRPVLKQAVRMATADLDYRARISLHADLGLLSNPQVFQLAVACGRALKPLPKSEMDPADRRWNYRDLAAGMNLVLGYPASVRELSDTKENRPKPHFFRRIAAAAEVNQGALRDVMTALRAMEPEAHGITRLRKIRQGSKLLTTTDLAKALRVEKARIRAMADAGVFGQRTPRGQDRKYDWFSEQDVLAGREFLDGRMFASSWARQVDLSVVDVRQLAVAGLIKAWSGQAVDRVFGGNFQLQTDSLQSFEAGLLSRIRFSNAHDEWVPIDWAFATIGGGYKPWAAVLAAALAGSLPHGLEYPGGYELKLGRLRIHRSVAEDIRRRALSRAADSGRAAPEALGGLRPKCLTRSEAQSLLNCLPADISRLCEHRRLKVVDKDPVSFDARSVEAFAERYVSIQELSALLQIKAGELARSLSYRDFPRSQSGFWRRRDLWGPAGIIASYERDPIFAVWEIPGAPKPVSFWPGLKSRANVHPLKLFSRQQLDHS